ncbi:MAG: hypothetical protein ACYDH9_27085 [Limisphaerales bacterium]
MPAPQDAIETRAEAAWILGDCGSAAERAVPDFRWRDTFLWVTKPLAEIGPPAKRVVPILLATLRDQDENLRIAAAAALRKIDPAAADEAGVGRTK